MRMVGQILSMGIAMMFISVFIGKQTINPSVFNGLMSSMKTGVVFSVFVQLKITIKIIMNTKSIILIPFFCCIIFLI